MAIRSRSFKNQEGSDVVTINAAHVVCSAGDEWTPRTATSKAYQSICWSPELGLFCAVVYSGTTMQGATSPDGVTWTNFTTPDGDGWIAVCWAPELMRFCAVSFGDAYAGTSVDGSTWTTSLAAAGFRSLCWSPELRLFCAVGDTGLCMTSPDGVVWTSQTAAEANDWRGVCWSPELGLFCAVSYNGTYRVMTSVDGANWDPHTASSASTWYGVCWSPARRVFCAVAADLAGVMMTSVDGTNWVDRSTGLTERFRAICWSPELRLFCAVGYTTPRCATSPDGITWAGYALPEAGAYPASVCWSPQLRIFCEVAEAGTTRIATSGIDTLQLTTVANGTVSKSFTANEGPTGAHTAIQGWLRIRVAGVDRFIPYW